MAIFVITALAVVVAAYLGWQRFLRPDLPSGSNDVLTDAEVIVQFRRRQRTYNYAFLVFVVMFPYMYWVFRTVADARDSMLGLPVDFHASLAFALTIVSVVTTSFVYACPRCGERPWAPGRRGMLMNPDECPSCGARFK